MALRVDIETEERAVAAANGDREALGDLYEQYAGPVLRFVRLKVGHDLMLAEDVAATTWERVAKSIRSYETKGNGFPAWLFTIARHTAAEHCRTIHRRREHLYGEFLADDYPDSGVGTDELTEAKLVRHQLAAAVRGLAPRQRRCINLRFYVGLSLNDTATVMGIKPNAVKQLQHRALNSLSSTIGPKESTRLPMPEVIATRRNHLRVDGARR